MENLLSLLGVSSLKELWLVSTAAMKILLILMIAGLLMRLVSQSIGLLKTHLERHATDDVEDAKRIETLAWVFRYISTVIIGVVTGMEILQEIGISIAPILAATGIVGVAVGFGAQSLIKDYFNGFFLLMENQIRRGDVIEAGGKGGLVEEFTLRYVKMRDYDGNVHFIPNSTITAVTNMSRGYAQSVIDIRLPCQSNTAEIIKLMLQVAEELRHDKIYGQKIIDDLEMAGVDIWNEAFIAIRCRFKVIPLEQWSVKREFMTRLKYALDQQGSSKRA